MKNGATVMLWGSPIGAVFLEEGSDVAAFEYTAAFSRSGIQVSPLEMPLARHPYSFPGLNKETFHGLPGLLAESLPDRYGTALINVWLAQQGREPGDFSAVERLCYVGTRGMGALEFEPSEGPGPAGGGDIQIGALVELASEVLNHRTELEASLARGEREGALQEILSVGTSAGGARAKAVIAWNPETIQVRSGQVDNGPGFEPWLLKFDGVKNNRDKDALADPKGYGLIEYAYSAMAKDAGVEMTACRLLEENGRSHFMTKRFDRDDDNGKIHMQSLGSIAHFDFNQPGAYSYEQALMVTRRLGLGPGAREQLFRRMAFNIVARNQDDHVKNIAFLMDRAGTWRLSPAFDVTYSFNPKSKWTSGHQMTLGGKTTGFVLDDFVQAGKVATLPRGRAKEIVAEVTEVVSKWPAYAEEAGVSPAQRKDILENLRLDLLISL